jgi:hypothetical protein
VHSILFSLLDLTQKVESHRTVIVPTRQVFDLDIFSVLYEENIEPGVGHLGFQASTLMKGN